MIAQRTQNGFSLLMSLIVLVVITLSSLSMMMMMKGGVTAAGNIAFRQAATRVADVGVEDAITWLQGQTSTLLQTDQSGSGYFAWAHDQQYVPSTDPTYDSSFVPFNPATFDFVNSGRQVTGNFSGYNVYYVIHRMAQGVGACSAAGCIYPSQASAGTAKQGDSFSPSGYGAGYTQSGLPYYRITVKVIGPRFNNRIVQAFIF